MASIMSSLFERVAAALFGTGDAKVDDAAERQLIDDTIEAIVDTVEPRVRMHSGYRHKLTGGVRRTIAHLRALAREGLEPILLSRQAWSQDPRINAFFATADDVPACIGRSQEIRRFFEGHPDCAEAYALLAMKREERTVLAPRFEGDMLKQDVAQTSVSFSGHRLLAPSADQAQTRLEIGRRVMQRLAQAALARIVALDQKATDLQQHKAYLGARLRLLNLARDGMEGIVGDPGSIGEQIRGIERELKETVEGYIEAKSSLATLEGYVAQIDAVLSHPEEQVQLTHTRLRLNRMGIKVEEGRAEPSEELALADLTIGDNLHVVIALVRIPRDQLPPKEDLIAQAERYL
jgi:hypothetical protein